MLKLRSTVVVLGVTAATAGLSAQVITEWRGGDGDWTDDNWDNGNPTADDRAVINDGTVDIDDDEVVDTIVLGEDGGLRIYGPGSLTLDNDDHNAHECPTSPPQPNCTIRDDSIVNGWLELRAPSGDAGDLIFTTNNHIFEGTGRIEDIKQGGRIEIDPDIYFMNRLTDESGWAGIHGSVYIFGHTGGTVDGEFRNEGRVQANSKGPEFTLTIDAVTKDNSNAEWITSCEAVLLFKREALDLEGDFTDDPPGIRAGSGIFDFEADIWTCGTFTRNGCCGIEVDDTSFSYATYVSTADPVCSNPGTSETSPTDCDDPWTVSSDVTASYNTCPGS